MKKWFLSLLIALSVVAIIWGNLFVFLLGIGIFVGVFLLANERKRQAEVDDYLLLFEKRLEVEDRRLRELAAEIVRLYEENRTKHPVREIFSEYFHREKISLEDLRQGTEDGLEFVAVWGEDLLDEVEWELDYKKKCEERQLQRELEALM